MDLQKIIKEFEKETGYTLEIVDNHLHYGGGLYLSDTGITSLPENGLTVRGYLDLRGTGITSLPENGLTVGGSLNLSGCTGITSLPENGLTVGGSLDLSGTGITSLPENGLTVGGGLYLSGCTGITSLPDNLVVGGGLDLSGCTGITSLPDNLVVGSWLDLRGTGITSLPDNLVVGGGLYLSGTGITSLPDNLVVGSGLDLSGCTGITSLPDNLVVGGGLYLRGTGITSLPDNLVVGGGLYLSGTGITDTSKIKRTLSAEARRKIAAKQNMMVVWEWSNRTYIKVDGIFSVVDSHHGNVWRVHHLGSKKQTYIVTDGENHYAHGDTIEEARKDLVYKICDRDKSEYEHLTLDSELTYSEAIECYRVITGACSAGTRNFCENILPQDDKKDKYTIREMIKLTCGQFGHDTFKDFFEIH